MRYAREPVPPELVAVCRKALAPTRSQRYDSVKALADDLTAFLEVREGSAWTDPLPRKLTKAVRRHPARATVIASLLLLAAILVAAFYVERGRQGQRDRTIAIERFLIDVPRIQAGVAEHPIDDERLDYILATQQFLEHYARIGIPLTGGRDSNGIAGALAVLSEDTEELARVAHDALYDLAYDSERAGAIHFHELRAGHERPPNPWLDDGTRQRTIEAYGKLKTEAPELIDLWPMLRETIAVVVAEDPFDCESWEANVVWWVDREDRLDPLLARVDELHGRKLLRFARLVTEVRGREQAAALLQRGLFEAPDSFWGHFELARYFERHGAGKMDVAVKNPEDAQHEELVRGAVDSYRRAQTHLEAAVALQPRSLWALTNLANVCKSLVECHGELEETRQCKRYYRRARECYERILEYAPAFAENHSRYARLILEEEPELALEHARKAVELAPGEIAVTTELADCLLELNDFEAAIEVYLEYAARRPDDSSPFRDITQLRLARAEELKREGDLDGAAEQYERALAACDEVEARDPENQGVTPARDSIRRKLAEIRTVGEDRNP